MTDNQKVFSPYNFPDYPIGCDVILTVTNPNRFLEGTLKWIGSYNNKFWCVVQLRENVEDGTNGVFLIDGIEVRLAECPAGSAHFVELEQISIPPKRLGIGDHCRIRGTEKRGIIRWIDSKVYGVLLRDSNEGPKGFYKGESRFTCGPNEGSCFCAKKDIEYLGPSCETESQAQRKLGVNNIGDLCGYDKGIQGENISSYLDTLLFICFAFTTNLQGKIPKNQELSELQAKAQDILLKKIVYPLRKSYYVSSAHVMEFREVLKQITDNSNYVGQPRDFLECFDDILRYVLNIDCLVELLYYDSSREVKLYSLVILCEPKFPYSSLDELFYTSSIENQYLLKKIPKFLVLSLSRVLREGQEGSFSCVIPCMELELKERLYDQQRSSGLSSTLPAGAHNHLTIDPRASTMVSPATSRLLLSGVVCFERSHYDCFARCGRISPECPQLKDCCWVHFSSLADRENDANVPRVQQVSVYEWIEYARSKHTTDSQLNDLLMPQMTKEDRDLATRLLDRSYAFIYENY